MRKSIIPVKKTMKGWSIIWGEITSERVIVIGIIISTIMNWGVVNSPWKIINTDKLPMKTVAHLSRIILTEKNITIMLELLNQKHIKKNSSIK